jgi:hypothetical protein
MLCFTTPTALASIFYFHPDALIHVLIHPRSLPHFLPSAALWGKAPSPANASHPPVPSTAEELIIDGDDNATAFFNLDQSKFLSYLNSNAKEFKPVFEDDDKTSDNKSGNSTSTSGSRRLGSAEEETMLPSFVVAASGSFEWGRARYGTNPLLSLNQPLASPARMHARPLRVVLTSSCVLRR